MTDNNERTYPSFRYHPSGETAIVRSQEEHDALGEDWHETPAGFGIETAPGAKPDAAIAANAPAEESEAENEPEPAPKKRARK